MAIDMVEGGRHGAKEPVDGGSVMVAGTQLTETTQAVDDAEPVSQDVIDAAQLVLMNGDPVEYIINVFNTIHVGDTKIGEMLLISSGSASIRNSAGINPNLSGGSGKGKSHSCKTILHLMPHEYVMNTSLSDKVLFYLGAKLQSGTVIFSDDTELSSDMESIIKRSTSEFQQGITHHTMSAKRQAQEMKIAPRILWWLASVDSTLDTQTLNRQVPLDVDDDPATDDAVVQHQLMAASTGTPEYPETFEVRVCREIIRSIKDTLVTVIIPFSSRIEWRGGDNRRNLPMFLDIVKVFAVYRHKQRRTELDADGGIVLYATEDDFSDAYNLYAPRAKAQANKLTAIEMRIVDYIGHAGSVSYNQVARAVGISYQVARNTLSGRTDTKHNNGGLLNKVKDLRMEDINVKDGEDKRISMKVFHLAERPDVSTSYNNIVSLNAVE